MALVETFFLKVKRAETPFYRLLHRAAVTLLQANIPVPRALRPVFSAMYTIHFGILQGLRMVLMYTYWEPLARARFASLGKRARIVRLPRITGKPRIHAGDNVQIHGLIHVIDAGQGGAELILEDGAQLGHNVTLLIARKVVVGAGAGIASECFVSDVEGPAFEFEPGTAQGAEPAPVYVGANAWVGRGSSILKGVTIGEAAIVGAASVVNKDVPPFSVAIGNPARVVVRTRPGAAAV